jgi:hypothetical protein
MSTKVFLIVALLVPGVGWVPGNDLDGWHDREQKDMLTCWDRVEFMWRRGPPRGFDAIKATCVERTEGQE